MSIGDLKIAINAALMAGKEILRIYNDPGVDFQIEHKTDLSPLTIADKNANAIIIRELETTDIPILSEEVVDVGYGVRKAWDRLWIVDPLDGTKEFIKRNGDFTVNIAFILHGEPVAGVIYVPVSDVLYFGEKTLGAYKITGTEALDLSDFETLRTTAQQMPFAQSALFTVVASRSHLSEETVAYLEKIKVNHPNMDIVSRGSSLKICLVAEGTADLYPRFSPTMEWDTAAGDAIVRAAGKMIYLEDEKTPLCYNRENLRNPFFIVK